MSKIFVLTCLSIASLLLTSCITGKYDNQTATLINQRSELTVCRSDLNLNLSRSKSETDFFVAKNQVLQKEIDHCLNTTLTNRGNMRNIANYMITTLQENAQDFFDCRLGSVAIERRQIFHAETQTLLLDPQAVAQTDMTVVICDLYTTTPEGSFIFCVLRPDENNMFKIIYTSPPCKAQTVGKNQIRFSNTPIRMRKGDALTLILAPGTTLHYDQTGTGMGVIIPLEDSSIGKLITVNLAENRKGLAFSCSFWGFSR